MTAMAAVWDLFLSLAPATIRLAAPLVLAALAGLFAERSGVIDIGLEGKMLGAAFAAAAAAAVTGSPWPALVAGILVAIALAMLHGLACITARGNQVVSGMAINILVAGLAPTLGLAWFSLGGDTPRLGDAARLMPVALPGADRLADALPVLGPLYARVLSGYALPVYLAAAAVPVTAFVLHRTRFGLRVRAAGVNPHAVDTAGIDVAALRFRALLCTGLLSGLAGTHLAIAEGAGFVRDMTAGRGYLALAALIFGRWRPVPALLACLLFALADAVQTRLQGAAIPFVGGAVPVQAIQALPYVLTVLLLAGFVGRARPPKALGQPFVKTR